MTMTDTIIADRIERSVDIDAPLSRVWSALTDHEEFGAWFRVRLDGPFVAGRSTLGQLAIPGFEHVAFEAKVTEVDPPHFFAFTWHPYPVEPEVDYSAEEPTLVEFRLQATAAGTRVTVSESGFERLPEHRRAEAYRMNDGGWAHQLENLRKYAAGV